MAIERNFWKAALWGGIISGLVMLVLEMIMNPVFLNGSMWGPSRMIGAILLGSEVLPPPATFNLGVLMAAAVVHFPLSILYAIIIGMSIRAISTTSAILVGAGIGVVIYLVNFYGFAAIFPWFANARNWVQLVIHIMFGLVAAWSFKSIYVSAPKAVVA